MPMMVVNLYYIVTTSISDIGTASKLSLLNSALLSAISPATGHHKVIGY